jgi:protein involved in polysaccharide export with SLBB domain
MNHKPSQPGFRPRAVQKPTPLGSAIAGTLAGPLWLAALGLFLGTSCWCAGDSLFTDFPVYQPATNILQGSMTTNQAVARLKTAGAQPPGGTNSAASLAPTNSMDTLDDTYRLAIGDRVSFQIKEDDDDPQLLTVMDSGDLQIPYLGPYPVVGKTCRELARELKVELEKTYYYHATVIITVFSKTKSRGIVYLVGAVRVPGPQDIPSDEVLTVSKAILRAGGFTDYADQRNVKITRKGSTPGAPDQTFVVNVEDILEKGKFGDDLPLKPDDLIYIPERLVRF